VSVDNRLVEYWRRQLANRRRLRAAPAPSEPAGGGPAPDRRDGSLDEDGRPSNVIPMAFEDR